MKTIHGGSYTSEYGIWKTMVQRCTNPNRKGYEDYGGRGISVCERWLNPGGFERFLADMGPRPSPQHSIDRKDVNGNYEPSNCQWSTEFTQKRNTRRNRWITHAGKTMCVADWAKELGVVKETLQARLRLGWTPERALTTPFRSARRAAG